MRPVGHNPVIMADKSKTKSEPRLIIEPSRAAIDQRIDIKATGFDPREEISLSVTASDALARDWSIEGYYKADREGVLDLASAPVASRLYHGTDYMHLFSLLRLEPEDMTNGPPVFLSSVDDQHHFVVRAAGTSGRKAEASVRREFLTSSVQYQPVRGKGLWGSFFAPETREPVPGVLVIGGAIGGSLWTERAAALLANSGFAALALTYFSTGDLPENLVEIPLEYFSAGLQWLRERPEVNRQAMGLLGKSKGAEAALLFAGKTSSIKCVVCYSPSAVVYQGLQSRGPILTARSSWTYRGRPLPFVPCYQEGMPIKLEALKNLKEIHSANLDTSYIVSAARIPVEEIDAPVLVVAGEADDVWPSARFGEMIMTSLARNQKIKGSAMLAFANAGHGIDLPYFPGTVFGGGSVMANARASEAAWKKCKEFLNENLHQVKK